MGVVSRHVWDSLGHSFSPFRGETKASFSLHPRTALLVMHSYSQGVKFLSLAANGSETHGQRPAMSKWARRTCNFKWMYDRDSSRAQRTSLKGLMYWALIERMTGSVMYPFISSTLYNEVRQGSAAKYGGHFSSECLILFSARLFMAVAESISEFILEIFR